MPSPAEIASARSYAKSGQRRVDHGTICGRSCANSGHYKPLCACVDRTFVNSNSARHPTEFFSHLAEHLTLTAVIGRDVPNRQLSKVSRRDLAIRTSQVAGEFVTHFMARQSTSTP